MKDEEKTLEGQSFYNEALTGSGTLTEDGTIEEPLPDPTVVRGLGPDRTSGGRRVRFGGLGDETTNVAGIEESGSAEAPAKKTAPPAKKAQSGQ